MNAAVRLVLRQLVLLAALALGSCGGGGGIEGDTGTTAGTDIGSGGTGVASGGVGSGGTGISGGGVGSGGTGATADSGVGSIDGFGSIIVNGVRYDIATARTVLSDASALKLGMTVRVTGTIAADLPQGTATLVVSAVELRGSVASLAPAAGAFSILGVQVSTDATTVYAGGLGSATDMANGMQVQVHGLPGSDGLLRATRIERLATTLGPVLTGQVQGLDRGAHTFRIGSQSVNYAAADFPGDWPMANLVNGVVVRVRAPALASTLAAGSVEPWNPPPLREGARLSLGGLVSDFLGTRSLRIDGVSADISGARISGSNAGLANGARVEASGTVRGGVLVVSTLKVREAAPPDPQAFSATGSVGAYRSPADFKVQGQDIDASNATFVNGTAADLGPGRKVQATGSRVRDDVLVADRVEFLP
ncbi:MAG: DUF5666 domain-containing protein [Ramlibacter sp.]